ncbi:ferritin [Geoalkalibacter halelectricus]|uniref:Ferritin n=1 Tax=Geoalkalibacter halelectricus TaxID=2847045 RepID=A0ABY5ZQF6_9BACT|nr:ferritin [Geoalkalibacter halelectricus]MDO3377511.1 ferritin [Geoalkalibacter halelectricus]UWZ80729.1 ferritin [Geoalkalibacter halelectricus]
MLSQKLQDALNEQMKNEFFSAYLYKAMAAYFEAEDLPGFAVWMRVQAMEEMTHGEKFFNFICEAGGRAVMLPIDAPRGDYASAYDVFEYALEHEYFVTDRINKLMDLAREESNHAAQIFLQWFVTEQVEEEASFGLMKKKLKRVDGDGRGLLMLDQEAGARTFVAPAGMTVTGA